MVRNIFLVVVTGLCFRRGAVVRFALRCLLRGLTGLASGVCALTASCDVQAEGAETLTDLVQQGAHATQQQRWDACVSAYTKALPLGLQGADLGRLGLCEERTGRFARSWTHLRAALDGAPSPIVSAPWTVFHQALLRVTERVALATVTTRPAETRVVVDGVPYGRGDGMLVALDPGVHRVAGMAPGYKDIIQDVRVSAGSYPNVHLELPPAGPPVLTQMPHLQYEAPKGCPEERAFRSEVALAGDGSDPFDAPRGTATLRVTFRVIPGGYEGQVQLTDEAGVTHPGKIEQYAVCESAARALAVDAYYVLPPVRRPSVQRVQVPIRVPFSEISTFKQPPPIDMDVSVAAMAYMLAAANFGDEVSAGFGIGGGIEVPYFSLALEFRGLPYSGIVFNQVIDPSKPYRVVNGSVAYWSASLVPCFRYQVAEWPILQACGVANAGVLSFSIEKESVPDTWQVLLGPRLAAELPFGEHFSVFALGEVTFAPSGAVLLLKNVSPETPDLPAANTKWQTRDVYAFFGGGVAVRFQ